MATLESSPPWARTVKYNHPNVLTSTPLELKAASEEEQLKPNVARRAFLKKI